LGKYALYANIYCIEILPSFIISGGTSGFSFYKETSKKIINLCNHLAKQNTTTVFIKQCLGKLRNYFLHLCLHISVLPLLQGPKGPRLHEILLLL
jgi:hypothetical protein